MLLCRKVTRLGFDVRYSPKHVFTVSTLSVDPVLVPNTKGGKVRARVLYFLYVICASLCSSFFFVVFICFSFGSKRSGRIFSSCKNGGVEVSVDWCNKSCKVLYLIQYFKFVFEWFMYLTEKWVLLVMGRKVMSTCCCAHSPYHLSCILSLGYHSFELHTFDHPEHCDACHKLLHGCYFQGYYCPCKISACMLLNLHLTCLDFLSMQQSSPSWMFERCGSMFSSAATM